MQYIQYIPEIATIYTTINIKQCPLKNITSWFLLPKPSKYIIRSKNLF